MADNPFSKASERAKLKLLTMTPEDRKKLAKAQGEYGVAVAESVRGSHKIWRKGKSGEKAKKNEKWYI